MGMMSPFYHNVLAPHLFLYHHSQGKTQYHKCENEHTSGNQLGLGLVEGVSPSQHRGIKVQTRIGLPPIEIYLYASKKT